MRRSSTPVPIAINVPMVINATFVLVVILVLFVGMSRALAARRLRQDELDARAAE